MKEKVLAKGFSGHRVWHFALRLLVSGVLLVVAGIRLMAETTVLIPKVTQPPKLEDFLSGEPQEAGLKIESFRQMEPGDGQPVSLPTRAYLSRDDQNLYAVFVCEDEPSKIRARMTRREQIDNDDVVGLFVDTFHDRQRAYGFVANPLGVQQDLIRTDGQDDDASFDTLWYSRGRLTEYGYAVWMAIPFKSLRFASTDTQTWGVAVGRRINRLNEVSLWPYITEREEGFVRQMAEVELQDRISPGRNIQLLPYGVFADARFLNPEAPDGPAFQRDRELRAGLDAKAVIRDALTLDLTVNPDFSQVESDEPQVTINQRFEVFVPEQRSFFIENAGYFRTPLNLFFSRRIAHPGYGARLTGKLQSLAVGALVMDDRAPGEALGTDDLLFEKRAVNGVLRVQHEFGRQSTVGVFASRRRFGSAFNELASVDARLRLSNNWVFTGQAVTSRTREQDGSATTGPAYYASLYHYGRHLTYGEEYTDISPNFRTELGFVPRVDIRRADHRLGPGSHYSIIWDHRGQLQEWMLDHWLGAELKGDTEIQGWWGEGYVLYRGIGFRPRGHGIYVSSERLKWLVLSGEFALGSRVNYFPAEGLEPFKGASTTARASVAVLPTPALRLEQTYFYNHLGVLGDDPKQGLVKGTSVFNNHILRTKLNYQFTRPLSFRFIFDYEGVLPNVSLVDLEKTKRPVFDVLMTYLLNPGTAVYVGYTERLENLAIANTLPPTLVRIPEPTTRTARQFFVKLSYLFRF